MNAPEIHYLTRKEINTEKWNECVRGVPNGLIYGRSEYLDEVCNWDALVMGDYTAVMPLTWNKKFGIRYLYQPFFTASLGIFGEESSDAVHAHFINTIPSHFQYWDIDVNEKNQFSQLPSDIQLKKRRNLFLPLSSSIDQIRERYSRLAHRKIRSSSELKIIEHVPVREVLDLYSKDYGEIHSNISAEVYERLANACDKLGPQHVQTYTSHFPDGEKAAFYLILTDEKFVYSVLGGSTKRGKTSGAFYALTDHILSRNATQEKIFRFEGSDIPGIAFFDQQFAPHAVDYYHLKRNRLPFPLNLIKR